MNEKNKRQSIIDLWRVVACFALLTHHSYLVREPNTLYPLYRSHYYVDLFFLLTGYFTARHFYGREIQDRGRADFEYFINKFKVFLPYTIPAIFIEYILESVQYADGGIKSFIGSFYDMPLEMLFLTESYTQVAHVVPMWFLSSMFIAFPVFLLILRIKDRYLTLFISSIFCVIFYNHIEIGGSRIWPKDLFRAMAGLLLGTAIYIVNQYIRDKELIKENKKTELLLTLVELACFVLPFAIGFFNCRNLDKNVIIMMTISILIATSGYSFTRHFHSRLVDYLAKLSLPVYIWQWPVGNAISMIIKARVGEDIGQVPLGIRLFIYYLVTVLISLFTYLLVERIKRNRNNKI